MSLETQIANRLVKELRQGLTWQQVVTAVQASTPQEKAAIVNAIKGNQYKTVGLKFIELVGRQINTLALSEAQTMLADDQLSRTELDRIL